MTEETQVADLTAYTDSLRVDWIYRGRAVTNPERFWIVQDAPPRPAELPRTSLPDLGWGDLAMWLAYHGQIFVSTRDASQLEALMEGEVAAIGRALTDAALAWAQPLIDALPSDFAGFDAPAGADWPKWLSNPGIQRKLLQALGWGHVHRMDLSRLTPPASGEQPDSAGRYHVGIQGLYAWARAARRLNGDRGVVDTLAALGWDVVPTDQGERVDVGRTNLRLVPGFPWVAVADELSISLDGQRQALPFFLDLAPVDEGDWEMEGILVVAGSPAEVARAIMTDPWLGTVIGYLAWRCPTWPKPSPLSATIHHFHDRSVVETLALCRQVAGAVIEAFVSHPAQQSELLAAIEGAEVYGRLALHVRLQGDQAASLAHALGQYRPEYIQMFERVLGNGRKYAGVRAALRGPEAWEAEAAALDDLVRTLFARVLD